MINLCSYNDIYTNFADFDLSVCVCVYVAVDEVKKKLVAHGFQELLEKDSWKIQPLSKVSICPLFFMEQVRGI